MIPSQYSVMEALVVKCDILNLSKYQLEMIIPQIQPSVVPKPIVVWAPVCSWSDQFRNNIKTDIIPCQYSVIEALVEKWHILKLSTYQLQTITAPGHPYVVPKLIVVWAPVCSSTDQFQEIYQILHHSLPIIRDGSTCSEVTYSQNVHRPIAKNNYTGTPLSGSKTHCGVGTSM